MADAYEFITLLKNFESTECFSQVLVSTNPWLMTVSPTQSIYEPFLSFIQEISPNSYHNADKKAYMFLCMAQCSLLYSWRFQQ